MNRFLKSVLSSTNHCNRLIRVSDPDKWLLLSESGTDLRLLSAAPDAESFDEFELSAGLLCPDGIFGAQGGSGSIVYSKKSGLLHLSFKKDDGIWHSSIKYESKLSDISSWAAAEKIPLPEHIDFYPGNLCIAKDDTLLFSWSVCQKDESSLTGISIRDKYGEWKCFELAKGKNAFPPILTSAKNSIYHMTWSQANGKTFILSFSKKDIYAGNSQEARLITQDGREPALIECDEGLLIVFEDWYSRPHSIVINNNEEYTYLNIVENDPRFNRAICHSYNLIKDSNGVPILFFAENHRNMVFCTRWQGEGWGPILPVPSILYDNCRGDAQYLQIGRLTVEQAPENSNDIGIFMQPEFGGDNYSRFIREKNIIPNNCIEMNDLKDFCKIFNLEHLPVISKKHPANPLIKPGHEDNDFNSLRAANRASIDKSSDGWKMWYTGMSKIPTPGVAWWDQLKTGYAVSRDSINWDFPVISGSDRNVINALPGQHCVYRDDMDPDPTRRFKLLSFLLAGEEEPVKNDSCPGWLYTSADGEEWNREAITLKAEGVMWQEHCPMCFFRDDKEKDPAKRWKSYGYTSMTWGRRACSIAVSADCKEWIFQKEPALPPETLGYPWVESGPESQVHGMVVVPHNDIYYALVQYQINAEESNIQLAISRDGMHFSPLFPGVPIINHGNTGEWDSMTLMPSNLFFEESQIKVFYTGTYEKLSSLGLAEFPENSLSCLQIKDNNSNSILSTVALDLDINSCYRVIIDGENINLLRVSTLMPDHYTFKIENNTGIIDLTGNSLSNKSCALELELCASDPDSTGRIFKIIIEKLDDKDV